MIIIGISGKKQGGKSAFVDHLQTKIPGSKVVRFADSLKQIVLDCFVPQDSGWKTPEDLDLDSVKNSVLPCGKTVRQLLQVIGTDWFRHTWEDCWINCYKKKIQKMYSFTSREHPTVILTPDVRFPNEVKAIQQMGGKVVRLLRAPFGNQDQHESETALDLFIPAISQEVGVKIVIENWTDILKFDLIYDNSTKTLDDTKKWIDEHFMKCFDWRSEMEGVSNMTFDLRRLVE